MINKIKYKVETSTERKLFDNKLDAVLFYKKAIRKDKFVEITELTLHSANELLSVGERLIACSYFGKGTKCNCGCDCGGLVIEQYSHECFEGATVDPEPDIEHWGD